MDTTFVLGLMLVFFVIPGAVIGAAMLVIREWNPGYLTRHKEKVLAVICIILAVYGASIICTEVEGAMYTGQPIAEKHLTATQSERMFSCSGGKNCSGVLVLHKGKYAGIGHKTPDQVVLCRKHLYKLAEHDEMWVLAGRMMSLLVKEGDVTEAEEMVRDLTLLLNERKQKGAE